MTSNAFAEDVAGNIRAARARIRIQQQTVTERMRDRGHSTWHRQTMGKVERAERRVYVDELPALAAALETTIPSLLGFGS